MRAGRGARPAQARGAGRAACAACAAGAARTARAARTAALLALAAVGCAPHPEATHRSAAHPATLSFWAMGREGEVVQELVREFEREHPDIRVDVQQIPWSAAHEKLLTAFVGRSTPDIAQLGNTWVTEFVALGALAPLDSLVAASVDLAPADYFPGIWDTNVLDGRLYGVPWYVDTRLLFYRTDVLRRAGYDAIPATWDEWKAAMVAVKRAAGEGRYAFFLPLNEWQPIVVLGLQAGSPLLEADATRGAFSRPEFLRALHWYVDLFEEGLAPPVRNNEIANMYQEFERETFSMVITGPWNLGEFARRLPAELQDAWSTSALPGPDAEHPGVSVAGGSSLVLFERSKKRDAAWKLVEFLSRPDQQLAFARLSGDLPARVAAWDDSAFAGDPRVAAFRTQLERVVSTPKIPEWEQIAARLQERVELAVRGNVTPEEVGAMMDREVDRLLEKRRWLLARRADDAEPAS